MQTRNNLYFNDHATINALGISTTIPSDRLLSMHSTGANVITVCFNDTLNGVHADAKIVSSAITKS